MTEGWVNVVFANSAGEYGPGDQAEVTIEDAKQLVTDGIANYATVSEAKKVGADPEDAASKKK